MEGSQQPSHDTSPGGGRRPIEPYVPAASPPPMYALPQMAAPPRGGRFGRLFGWSMSGLVMSLLVFSVVTNAYLLILIASMTGGPYETTYEEGVDQDRIVILPIRGLIDDNLSTFVHSAFQKLRQNPPKALILHVDSPGGTIGASDRIWQDIARFRQDTGLPVVASMGSMATSGGYYVLTQSDWIFAEPTTVTGSIGVIAQSMTIERLLEKIGVTPEVLMATGAPRKDIGSPLRTWTDKDRQRLTRLLDYYHERFISVVYEGRKNHLSLDAVKAVADGDIYNADEAVENQLVDAKGFLSDAITKAKELAGVTDKDPKINVMNEPQLGLAGLLRAKAVPLDVSSNTLRRILVELSIPRLEYRYP